MKENFQKKTTDFMHKAFLCILISAVMTIVFGCKQPTTDSTAEFTVTYKNGDTVLKTDTNVAKDTVITAANIDSSIVTVDDGYVLLGWAEDGDTTPVESITITKDTVISAVIDTYWELYNDTDGVGSIRAATTNYNAVKIKESFRNDGAYASKLPKAIVMPEKWVYNTLSYYITNVVKNAFANLASLESITFPSTITVFRTGAVADVPSLKTITVKSSTAFFYSNAFSNALTASINFLNETVMANAKTAMPYLESYMDVSSTPTETPVDPSAKTAYYTVYHYKQNVDGTSNTLIYTDTLTGTIGETTTASANIYEGFTAGKVTQATILSDGSTVVKIYYTRNSVTLTFSLNGGSCTSLTDEGTLVGLYGATVTVATPTKDNYTFNGWSPSLPATFPATDTTYTAQWKITSNLKYSLGDTGPAGGTIFYANYNETTQIYTYLEAAPADLDSTYEWDSNATNLSGLGEAIGTGSANTTLMVQQGSGFEAANACASYTYNSYDDWFMASRQELQQLRKFLIGETRTTAFYNTFTGRVYFSSSQFTSGNTAYYSYIKGNGDSDKPDGWKKEKQNVRPIRLFTRE